jgi:cholesterol 7-desaturase
MLDFLKRWRAARSPAESADPEEAALAATYPHPYPSGWYHLLDSAELGPGQVTSVKCLGKELAVFRGEGGRASALLAHCPHMGANLAFGAVAGDCVECPFHKWRFDGDGKVVHIPYAERIGGGMRARAFPVDELYGQIFAWHDVTMGGPRAPQTPRGEVTMGGPAYSVPREPPIDEARMSYRGSYDAGLVRMHLLEFADNTADLQHFKPLHGEMRVPWTSLRVPGMTVRHEVGWRPDPELAHVCHFWDHAELCVLGRTVPRSSARATTTFIGPASIVLFRFEIPSVGRLVMYQTHTPVRPLVQRVRFRWYAEDGIPDLLARYVIGGWISQWREDVTIWRHKIYQSKPMLAPEDGPILQMRRWFDQFYPRGAGWPASAQGGLAQGVREG